MSNLTPENIEKLFYKKPAKNYKEFQKKNLMLYCDVHLV